MDDQSNEQVLIDFITKAARFNREIIGCTAPSVPTLLNYTRQVFRTKLKQEELDEFKKAHDEGNLEDAVDAVIDLMYVCAGTLYEMGVVAQPVFNEVHQANMRKVRGALSKRPGSQGYDATKPENWVGPSHTDYMSITSEDVQAILAVRRGEARFKRLPKEKDFDFFSLPKCSKKLLVMGYARHGKDTVCELLRDKYGLRFTSSSQFCADRVVFPALQKRYAAQTVFEKPDFPIYETAQQCFDDRANHRKLWYDLIIAHNTPDLTRLGREIFEDHDVYCGIRNAREFHALRNANIFDVVIWVDATERGVPIEDESSCTVKPWMADYVLDNNGSLEDLKRNLDTLMGNF